VFPVGIGLRDPRSQKRDPTARRGRLGHPSVSPFDSAEGTSFVSLRGARFRNVITTVSERVAAGKNRRIGRRDSRNATALGLSNPMLCNDNAG
jgi:hypothetical protein